jgi:hypothetical protein
MWKGHVPGVDRRPLPRVLAGLRHPAEPGKPDRRFDAADADPRVVPGAGAGALWVGDVVALHDWNSSKYPGTTDFGTETQPWVIGSS